MPYPKKYTPHNLVITKITQAGLYLQLSRLEAAGIPTLQAFELLKSNNQKIARPIKKLQQLLKQGNTIAVSGYKAGLFSEVDRDLIEAGELGGNIGLVYKQLAQQYTKKISQINKIKSKCYLPMATLTIALFIHPLPFYILNKISFLDYLVMSIGQILKISLFLYSIIKLPYWLTQGKLQFIGMKNLVYSLQLKLPVISSLIKPRQVNEFLRSLGVMLNSGVPIAEALEKAIKTIENPLLRKSFDIVIVETQKGESFNAALSTVSEIEPQVIQLLLVGEKSGKLAGTILHQVKIEQENIDLKDELFAEWLPRIFYLLLVAWLASSIVSPTI